MTLKRSDVHMSWIMKMLYTEDLALNVLFAGLFNWTLGIPKSAKYRFGRMGCTISSIVGANMMLNRRTLCFAMQLGWWFFNPNHVYEAAVRHNVVTKLTVPIPAI